MVLDNKTLDDILKNYETVTKNSVQKNDLGVRFKRTKKPANIDFKKLMIGVVATATVVVGASAIKSIKDTRALDNRIDDFSSDLVGMIDEKSEYSNLVTKNSYHVGSNDEGKYALNHSGLASDIATIVSLKPELLDSVLYNVYFKIGTNRLGNMDRVMELLKEKGVVDTNFFLEYLSNGLVVANDNTMKAIEDYKDTSDFSKLSNENQNLIRMFIKEYQESCSYLTIEGLNELKVGERR